MKREEQAEISSLIASLEKQGVLMRYHARVRHVGNGDPLGPIFEHRVLGISPLVARMLRAINGMPVSELMKKGQRG